MRNKRDWLLRERVFVEGETETSLSPIESDSLEKKDVGRSGKLTETVHWLRILDRTRIMNSYEDNKYRTRMNIHRSQRLNYLKDI